jgi:hypothetical protein
MALEILADQIESTAEWRERKAVEYPDDERNREAAEILRALAASVRALPDDDPVVVAYEGLGENEDEIFSLVEMENEMLKRIGFHDWTDDGREFIATLVGSVKGELGLK